MKYKINKDPRGPLYITESEETKLNYNCPADQKSGEGPGSCGGATGKEGSASSKNEKEEFSKGREEKSKMTDRINKSLKDVQNEATDDFADNMGEKPDSSEILQKGMDLASDLKLTGKSAEFFAEKYSKEYDKAWKNAASDAKAQGFSNDEKSKPSKSDTGSLKGLREANDKGLITVAGKVKKDFSAGGKSYKKGDYVTHHVDGKWQDEK